MQKTFAEVLETIEKFTEDEKETLVDILQHRLAEAKRQRIFKSVKQARKEYEKGEAKVATVDEIMSEILS